MGSVFNNITLDHNPSDVLYSKSTIMTAQDKLNLIEAYTIFKDDCYQLLEDGILSVEEYIQQTNDKWEETSRLMEDK
jgi:hypothetical protein